MLKSDSKNFSGHNVLDEVCSSKNVLSKISTGWVVSSGFIDSMYVICGAYSMDKRVMDKRSKTALWMISIANGIIVGPQNVLISFQTSIGVKGALGATNALVYAVVFFSSAIFMYLPTVTLLGRKKTVIVGSAAVVMYSVAMLHVSWWTLLPAAVFMGIGDILLWTAPPAIVGDMSRLAGRNTADTEDISRRSMSLLMALLALGQGVACLVAEAVLKTLSHQVKGNASLQREDNFAISSCGANDCPMRYSFEQNSAIFNNLIPSPISLDVLVSVFVGMQIIGIILFIIFIPSQNNNNTTEEAEAFINSEKQCESFFKRCVVGPIQKLAGAVCTMSGVLTLPTQLEYGLVINFIWSDFNRSFISCPIGVEEVGLLSFILNITSFLTCLLILNLPSSWKVSCLYTSSMIFEIAFFLGALFWTPSHNTLYMVYVFNVLMGFVMGLKRSQACIVSALYFTDLDAAYTMQNGSFALGAIIAFAWTTPLCVDVKLKIILCFSLVSTMFLFVAEYRRSGKVDSRPDDN